MLNHVKWLYPALTMVLLLSCSLAQDFQEMQEDAEKAMAAIEQELGGEVAMEWEIVNGEITHIGVTFVELPPEGIADSLALKAKIQSIVEINFRRPVPEVTVVAPVV